MIRTASGILEMFITLMLFHMRWMKDGFGRITPTSHAAYPLDGPQHLSKHRLRVLANTLHSAVSFAKILLWEGNMDDPNVWTSTLSISG